LFVAGVGYGALVLFIPHITDSLEKEQREDVGLEIGGVNWSPEDVGSLPEVAFALSDISRVPEPKGFETALFMQGYLSFSAR